MNERSEPTHEDLDSAIIMMQATLNKIDRDPRAAAAITKTDQLGAILRDMNEEEWECAVSTFMEETGIPEAEVRNWFGRLSGKCGEGDAQWTGVEGMKP